MQQASITVADEALTAWGNLSAGQQQTAADFANAVTDLVDSTQKAIESQMNMFQKAAEVGEVSGQTLIDNMQSQIDAVTEWEKNLTTLADKGINQGLLQYLSDMGPKGAKYVNAFNQMTDEELQKANDLWAQSVDIKSMTDEWGQKLLESGTENIAKSMGGLKDVMETSGADTALGLAKGIQSAASQCQDAAKEMGINTVESVNDALGVASPSWKTRQAGDFLGLGLIEGINGGIANILNAAKHMAEQTVQAIEDAIPRWRLEDAGYNFDMGLADGIYAGMSWVTAAAQSVAWAAVQAAESELGIHSPSTVARDEIGKYYGEGLAIGITDMTGRIKDAVGGLVSPLMHPINTTSGSNQQMYATSNNTMSQNTTNYGGVNVNVYGAEGQDVEALADIVSDRIIELARREA